MMEVSTYTNEPGKERRYTYTSTRPHSILSTVSREARTAVFENSTPLFQLGTDHTFITVCLERDTILLDAAGSYRGNRVQLKRLAKAIGSEKCQKITKLAVEDPVRCWGSRPDLAMTFMERDANHLLELFPNIKTLMHIPLARTQEFGYDRAIFHLGELEFVPMEIDVSTVGVTNNAFQQSRRRIDESLGLTVEYLQLGIVGGRKCPVWDYARRHHFWRLMTEEENENERASETAYSERGGESHVPPTAR